MKKLLVILFRTIPSFATVLEISYDCGSGTGSYDLTYQFGTSDNGSFRVRFTAPPSFYDAKLVQTKVLWHNISIGGEVQFHFVIRELDTGLVLTSGNFIAPNQFIWTTHDLSSLNYHASSHDFYIELIPTSSNTNGLMGCGHNPVDWRSQKRDDVYFPIWTNVDHDMFVHVFLDDSFIAVEPTSLGNLKALYR